MFRQWIYIGLLILIGIPAWAQNDRAIRLEREDRGSEQRVALVIGNGQYVHIDTLKNPVNDAMAMARVLREIGFEVIDSVNVNRRNMRAAIRVFDHRMDIAGGVALFYFSGHGLQVKGKNYLVPVDAEMEQDYEVSDVCVSTDSVLEMMEGKGEHWKKVIILDACRNNPFQRGNKSIGSGGLVEIRMDGGALIAYATAPGKVAKDGVGNHSPYTDSLIKHIKKPGIKIFDMFTEVRSDVMQVTQELFSDSQIPWFSASIPNFSLVPSARRDGETIDPPPPPPFPLHEAARQKNMHQTILLLDQGVNPNERDNAGWTPLHHAVAQNAHEIAEVLLRGSADVMAQTNSRQTPLELAELANAQQTIAVLSHSLVGTTFSDCDRCPEMVMVPSGSFTMGSRNSGRYYGHDEIPLHRVNIGYPLAVGVYEVTFAEWDACVADGGCEGYIPPDESWGRYNRPVVNVSWEDAQSYVRWLSQRTGESYRLLSESEWEYVARAGTTTQYSWGNDIEHNRANCEGCGSQWDDEQTAPVGSFSANAWGVHDMYGNVWEWVEDCWNDSYVGAPADGSAWESGDCSGRVLRGGSWDDEPRNLHSANRFRYATVDRFNDYSHYIGFRVVRRF